MCIYVSLSYFLIGRLLAGGSKISDEEKTWNEDMHIKRIRVMSQDKEGSAKSSNGSAAYVVTMYVLYGKV